MIFVLELVAFVCGIYVLVTGRINTAGNKAIVGLPARLIGGVLAAWLPISFAIGLVIGMFLFAMDPDAAESFISRFWWLDIAVGACVIVLVVILSSTARQYDRDSLDVETPVQNPLDTQDTNSNPYDPPRN